MVFAPATGRLHGGVVGEGAWVDEGEGRRAIRTSATEEPRSPRSPPNPISPRRPIDYLEAAVGVCGYVSGRLEPQILHRRGRRGRHLSARCRRPANGTRPRAMRCCSPPGECVDGPDGAPLGYGKRAFLNRAFVATGGWKAPRLAPFLEPFCRRRRPSARGFKRSVPATPRSHGRCLLQFGSSIPPTPAHRGRGATLRPPHRTASSRQHTSMRFALPTLRNSQPTRQTPAPVGAPARVRPATARARRRTNQSVRESHLTPRREAGPMRRHLLRRNCDSLRSGAETV